MATDDKQITAQLAALKEFSETLTDALVKLLANLIPDPDLEE